MSTVVVSYCGVCCSHCAMRTRIPKMAKQLERFVEAYRYGDWITYITNDFAFENFMKGLNWFAGSGCPSCLQGGGMPNCEVRDCCKEKGVKNCYFCDNFPECEKLAYQRETYSINENYEKIMRIGYENWLEEQEDKRKAGFNNIWFLEKKASQVKILKSHKNRTEHH